MYYGWNIPIWTDEGWQSAARYDNETNVPANITPGQWISVSDPSPTVLNSPSHSVVVLIPISTGVNTILGADRIGSVSAVGLPIGEISPGIIVAEPTPMDALPAGAVLRTMKIGVIDPATVAMICIAAAFIMGMIYMTVKAYSKAWAEVNYQRATEAANDVILKNMEVVDETDVDLNGDGVTDIHRTTWANGKVVAYATSAYGVQALGTENAVIENEGTDYEPVIPDPPNEIPWTWIIVGAVIIFALVVLGPRMSGSYSRESGPSVVLAR